MCFSHPNVHQLNNNRLAFILLTRASHASCSLTLSAQADVIGKSDQLKRAPCVDVLQLESNEKASNSGSSFITKAKSKSMIGEQKHIGTDIFSSSSHHTNVVELLFLLLVGCASIPSIARRRSA